jgi:hypothetical protein
MLHDIWWFSLMNDDFISYISLVATSLFHSHDLHWPP